MSTYRKLSFICVDPARNRVRRYYRNEFGNLSNPEEWDVVDWAHVDPVLIESLRNK